MQKSRFIESVQNFSQNLSLCLFVQDLKIERGLRANDWDEINEKQNPDAQLPKVNFTATAAAGNSIGFEKFSQWRWPKQIIAIFVRVFSVEKNARVCSCSMDCVGLPGVYSEFHAALISNLVLVFLSDWSPFPPSPPKFWGFFIILSKRSHREALQSQLFSSFSVVETRPFKLSYWVILFNDGTEKT